MSTSLSEFLPDAQTVMSGLAWDVAGNFGKYVFAAAVVFVATAGLGLPALTRLQIRPKRPGASQMIREFFRSLRTTAVFSIVGLSILAVVLVLGLPFSGFSKPGNYVYFPLSFAAMVLVHDTYFYWTHRAMHLRRMFPLFHAVHHSSFNPTPWSAYSFSVLEAAAQGAFIPLYLLAVPTDDAVVSAFILFMITINAIGHCGYEIYPGWLVVGRWTGVTTSVTHHDLHHRTFRYNYGLYFRHWDRLMKTEHPQFEEIFREVRWGRSQRKQSASFIR